MRWLFDLSRYVSFVQQIGPDEEAILANIPRKTRYMVRKALKQPFSMEATTDPSAFIDLYTRNLRKLGTRLSGPALSYAAAELRQGSGCA